MCAESAPAACMMLSGSAVPASAEYTSTGRSYSSSAASNSRSSPQHPLPRFSATYTSKLPVTNDPKWERSLGVGGAWVGPCVRPPAPPRHAPVHIVAELLPDAVVLIGGAVHLPRHGAKHAVAAPGRRHQPRTTVPGARGRGSTHPSAATRSKSRPAPSRMSSANAVSASALAPAASPPPVPLSPTERVQGGATLRAGQGEKVRGRRGDAVREKGERGGGQPHRSGSCERSSHWSHLESQPVWPGGGGGLS